jgi:hypothetical protein
VGQAAGIIIEDEIHVLKVMRETFPKARTFELAERVSPAIRDETKRAKFQQVMSKAIRTL